MLDVKVFMNSSIEDVLAFKCCNLADQNLEIHVKNLGISKIRVPSHFLLKGKSREMTLKTVYPPGGQIVAPGEAAAFYCSMDEDLWKHFNAITAFDDNGRPFCASL